MQPIRNLYERLQLLTRIYRIAAVIAVLAAGGFAARLYYVNRQIDGMRRQAADIFYQMKEMELQVARLGTDAPQRLEFRERRAGLEAIYNDWLRRLDETRAARPDERAIRAAVARLGEAPVLVSASFITDVRARVAEWRRTPDYARALRAADAERYPTRIESVLVANNLPPDLKWIAFQESRFLPRAVGPPTRFGIAKGMWQLMPETARQYGLRIGPLVGQPRFDPGDQRHDPTRSTGAAIRYVNDLYLLDAQGSGLLVMASYNAGQTRIVRLLRSMPASPRERNFWRLIERHRDAVPDETYGYVVGIVAAAAVAAEPGAFSL